MQQNQVNNVFALTRQDQASRVSSKSRLTKIGSQIVNSEQSNNSFVNSEFAKTMGKIAENQSVKVKAKINELLDEQESYEKINEIEYSLIEVRSDLRKEQRDIESSKSAQQMSQFITNAEFKKLDTTLKHQLSYITTKIERMIGESMGYNQNIEKQLSTEKKECEQLKIYINTLTLRVNKLEEELGVESYK